MISAAEETRREKKVNPLFLKVSEKFLPLELFAFETFV